MTDPRQPGWPAARARPCQPITCVPFEAFPDPLPGRKEYSLVSSRIKATGAGLVKNDSYKRFLLNKTQISDYTFHVMKTNTKMGLEVLTQSVQS